ncbi:MAG: redox-sensing transcriptional repressor Rex, partial [Oscillospiraceae bacterium]
ISSALELGEVQVRKDLSAVSSGGKPKTGYNVNALINDIENFLGYNDVSNAVIIGVGNLGTALLLYDGFKNYGLNIIAGFDNNINIVSTELMGKSIFPLNKLNDICMRLKVHIGIITVPADKAQEICDLLVDNGIKAIWNFAPTHLVVPPDVLVQNENMASSLALLSNHLFEQLNNVKERDV